MPSLAVPARRRGARSARGARASRRSAPASGAGARRARRGAAAERRLRLAARQRVDQRRLLAGRRSARAPANSSNSRVAAAARRVTLVERRLELVARLGVARRERDHRLAGVDRAAATAAPSSTRCGARCSSTRSFSLAGSPSVPLATHDSRARGGRRPRAACVATGNAAPPRPRRPERSTSSIRRPEAQWRRSGNGPCSSTRASPVSGRARRRSPAASAAGESWAASGSSADGAGDAASARVDLQLREQRDAEPPTASAGGDRRIPAAPSRGREYWSGLPAGPSVTRLLVICTPPPLIGWPWMRIRSLLSCWPWTSSAMSTSTPPSRGTCRNRPVTAAVNVVAFEACAGALEPEPRVTGARPPRLAGAGVSARDQRAGVPARLAQPAASGPRGATRAGPAARSRPPPSADTRVTGVLRPAGARPGRRRRRASIATHPAGQQQHPVGLGVAARAETVDERDRPARVGEPVGRAPRAVAHPAPERGS